MSHHVLLEYIRKAKDLGGDDADIMQKLLTAGWYRVDVQDAMELYTKLTTAHAGAPHQPLPQAPAPGVFERIAPRSYDPHIIAVATLSFAIGFIGYLIFAR
jgi:uncharacterized protein Smg (DUF494 family)